MKGGETVMRRGKKAKILYVEDHRRHREILSQLLRKGGYKVKTDDSKGGIKRIIKIINRFKPHLLILDLRLKGYSGLDVLEAVRERNNFEKIIISFYGDCDQAHKAMELGVLTCISKPISISALIKNERTGIEAALRYLAAKKKDILLTKLRKDILLTKLKEKADIHQLPTIWKNISDIKETGSGSEIIYTNIGKLKEVRTIGLYLTHTKPNYGSCISIAYGCNKNCPICKSGTEEKFLGYYDFNTIAALQELVLRESFFYDSYFWLHEESFFVAVMGAGDIAFNFPDTIQAMEIIYNVFKVRFVCNISTAFIAGVKQLIDYVDKIKFIPNLQISVHATDIAIRRLHVDSTEDPRQLCQIGLDYARKTNTTLTVNYGLTTLNSDISQIKELLSWLDPEVSRVKYTLLNLPDKCKLIVAERSIFEDVAKYTESQINYEIFNEKRQMGRESGAYCGSVVNKII